MKNKKFSELYRTYRPRVISQSLNKFSRFHNAADMLIEAGHILHLRVDKHKRKYGEDANYRFFRKIERTLLHAYNFINDLQAIYERNQYVENENRFLVQQINQLTEELNVYRTIESLVLEERLNEKLEIVNQKIDKKS